MSRLRIIGERLNSSNASARALYETRSESALAKAVESQLAGGAYAIDLNASMLMKDERESLLWAARIVRDRFDAVVSLDSPDASLLLDCAAEFGSRGLLNSFTADTESIERAIPVLSETGATAIFMLKDSGGVPETAMLRLELASRVSALTAAAGIDPGKILLDPVVTPVATSRDGLSITLDTIEGLRRNFPNYASVAGISNASFGLPKRRLVNRTFLVMAITRGLGAAICDPTDTELVASVMAAEALSGDDPGCRNLLAYHRATSS